MHDPLCNVKLCRDTAGSTDRPRVWLAEQTSVDDKEAGNVVSAINCYFMCEVRLAL